MGAPLIALLLGGCAEGEPAADSGADGTRELDGLQGAWPRPARTRGVCADSRGFEVLRTDSPTGFGLIDRTEEPERSFRILAAHRDEAGGLELAIQRDQRPVRHLAIAIDDGRATVTWTDPPRSPFVLVTPDAARHQPVKPCPP